MKKLLILLLTVAVILMTGSVFAYTPGEFDGYDLGGATVYLNRGVDEDLIREAEEIFNVTIRDEQDLDVRERVLSGEATHDIYNFANDTFWGLIGQGLLLPITEIVPDYYDGLGEAAQGAIEGFTYRDQGYALWHGPMYGVNNTMRFVMWNKDLFEELGLPDLNELYQEGDYTWDRVREIGLEVTADTTGDDEIDRWGIWSLYPYIDLMVSNEAHYVTLADNEVIYTGNSPEAIEAWETGYQWFQEDEILNIAWDDSPWREGRVAIFPTDLWRFGGYHDADFDWGILPLPKGPNADRHHVAQNIIGAHFLPVTTDQPEAMIALTDFLTERPVSLEEFEQTYEANMQNAINDWAPDRFSADILERYKRTWDGHLVNNWTALFGDLFWDTRADILNGEVTAAEGWSAISDQAQAILDDAFRF